MISFDMHTGEELWRVGADDNIDGVQHLICFSVPHVISGGTDSGRVLTWDGKTGSKMWQMQHPGKLPEVTHLTCTVDGLALLSGTSNGTVMALKRDSGEVLWMIETDGVIQALTHHGSTNNIFVATSLDRFIALKTNGEVIFNHALTADRIVLGSHHVIFLVAAGAVIAWDTRNRAEVWRNDIACGKSQSITSLIYLLEDQAICVGTGQGELILLAAANGRCVAKVTTEGQQCITELMLTPMGRKTVQRKSVTEMLASTTPKGRTGSKDSLDAKPSPTPTPSSRRSAASSQNVPRGIRGPGGVVVCANRFPRESLK